MKHRVYLIACLIIVSCSKYSQGLEESLKLAGNNKSELKKVLKHYKKNTEDSLKYKAACYLIDNMKWHKSKIVNIPSELWDLYWKDDSLSKIYYKFKTELSDSFAISRNMLFKESYENKKSFLKQKKNHLQISPIAISDLQQVSSKLLINNIESAFSTWKTGYNTHLTFEQFCEFILPYRINNEPIFNIRHVIQNNYDEFLSEYSLDGQVESISAIQTLLEFMKWDQNKTDSIVKPDLGFFNILFLNLTDCEEKVEYVNTVARSVGIPVAMDFTLRWLHMPLRHFWCTTVTDSTTLPYNAIYHEFGDDMIKNTFSLVSTVFRKTFKANKISPYFMKHENEPVPGIFSSPCIYNVTEDYHQVTDIEMDITKIPDDYALCYFCIFTASGWVPVQWGKIKCKRNKITFKKIPINITGIPCYYHNKKMIPCGKLIKVLNEGKYLYIKPDNENTIDLNVYRKYPYKYRMYSFALTSTGSVVQGSDAENFSEFDTLLVINDTLLPFLRDYELNNNNYYRYYRIIGNQNNKKKGRIDIALLEFLDKNPGLSSKNATLLPVFSEKRKKQTIFYKINGKPIGNQHVEKSFDGDPLTYASSWKNGIGMDFGKPVKINKIRILPRNGHNIIVTGDTYELFYWKNGWRSSGKQKAIYNYLTYKKIPSNTLYWLKNLSGGKEELPFYYRNGRQYFSNYDDFIIDSAYIKLNKMINQYISD